LWVMNCLPCQHRGRCGSKTSDDGHQRRLDEHPEKMRQRRETVELAAYAASHPGLDGSAHGKTARLSIEVPIIFGGLSRHRRRGCLGQTEAEYNGSNSKQPWIHRHGEPQRVSANILA
jgi:hypothetical protein